MCKKFFLVLFVFVYCLTIGCSDSILAPFPYRLPISIMIWNQGLFNYGSGTLSDNSSIEPDIETIKNYIISNDCDICFFTEYASYLDQEQSMPSEILYKDKYFYRYHAGGGYESKGVVSKIPFSASYHSLTTSGRSYVIGCFYLNEELIHYVLIHLMPGLDREVSHYARLKELQEILSMFEDDDRVIVVGDFNTPQKFMSQELEVLHNNGFIVGNGSTFGTYPTWQNDPNDNIAVKNLMIEDFWVDQQLLRSDHKMCKAIINIL